MVWNMSQQIKRTIDIPSLLEYEGIGYKQFGRNQIQFSAIWRSECNPSCVAKRGTHCWVWYDHGTGDGGTIIDLAMRIWNCSTGEAISRLYSMFSCIHTFKEKRRCVSASYIKDSKSQEGLRLLWTLPAKQMRPQTQRMLYQERGLDAADIEASGGEIGQIKTSSGRQLTGIIWQRGKSLEFSEIQQGGRKMCSGPRDLLIFGDANPELLIITEGIWDAMAMRRIILARGLTAYMSMGGTGMTKRAIEWVIRHLPSATEIIIATDADRAGNEAAVKLIEALSSDYRIRRHDCSPAKDPGEQWLIQLFPHPAHLSTQGLSFSQWPTSQ